MQILGPAPAATAIIHSSAPFHEEFMNASGDLGACIQNIGVGVYL